MSIHPDHRHDAGTPATDHPPAGTAGAPAGDDTLDLRVDDLVDLLARSGTGTGTSTGTGTRTEAEAGTAVGTDLLDAVASWAPAVTRFGVFRLVPVRPERDLPLLTRWMNDPAVAAFWELAGPDTVTADHVGAQLEGDGRSVPCLGVLDSTPMSYFEIYRADLDPLARAYPALPHDTGVHLLLGGAADRGRGVGTVLLRTVADLVLDHRPRCTRVVAEPDIRNTPSVSAFLSAGFRYAAEIDLPDKRAALMIRDRSLRHVL
ncbi:GNAT family N-acetyltransferase [Streptomyces roseolus]|uniref:GNAT family N-acetyltransferase n=1 Tax=Streptomyces roseolus TaxID=67358 RepID=UPI0016757AD3|nr:GNAT family N-acetyltransferase [Streptomyces roseolus]GGR58543.1 N-acetyltransferase [Streptomyces roseolus]